MPHIHIDNEIQTRDGAVEDRQKINEGVCVFEAVQYFIIIIFKEKDSEQIIADSVAHGHWQWLGLRLELR